MRTMSRAVTATLTIVAAITLSLPLSALVMPDLAWAESGGAQAVVTQETVTAKPYDLALAPDGEFRILHFNAGLVSSVLVAKPWLLTVLIQGNDVVLQAKATSGTTQLVAYIGDAGTLWQVTVASHGPAPTRIVVRAPGEGPAVIEAPPPARAPAQAAQPGSGQDPRLAAFLQGLSPEQRAAFTAWQKHPTSSALVEWLAGFGGAQRAAFDALVQARVITVSSPLGPQAGAPAPPPLVDTTTVIGQPSAPAQPGDGATGPGAALNVAGTRSALDVGLALHADVENVPQGITVTVSATQAGNGLEVRYAIHNGLGVNLAGAHVVATDGQGHPAAVSGVPAAAIATGKDASGVLTARASSFPVVLHWAWNERTTETILFVGHTVSHGSAQFDVVVTP